MADSNSEPPRCPCGFWGSAQTMGLCSQCYKEHQTKNEQVDQSNPNKEKPSISAETISQAISSVQPMDTTPPESSSQDVSGGDKESTPSASASTDQEKENKSENGAETAVDNEASASTDPSPGQKKEKPEGEDTIGEMRPPQKNKKRCFQCNTKLELAIRQIGKCRCDYIFCQLHRLPEQHNCIYDHKEKGRQEAREKMVSPKKHMGTSLKRIDSDS